MSRRYMIGDEYGNMWSGKNDEFYCNVGHISKYRETAMKIKRHLEEEYTRLEGKLEIWEITKED